MQGAVYTAWMAVASIAAGTSLGVLLGVLATVFPAAIRAPITAYVFIVRGIPILVLMFLAYYALPALGVRAGDYVTVTGALVIYCTAYVIEITRGAILAVPRTQIDAARGLGMRLGQVLRLVVLPQAIRLSLPPCSTTR